MTMHNELDAKIKELESALEAAYDRLLHKAQAEPETWTTKDDEAMIKVINAMRYSDRREAEHPTATAVMLQEEVDRQRKRVQVLEKVAEAARAICMCNREYICHIHANALYQALHDLDAVERGREHE